MNWQAAIALLMKFYGFGLEEMRRMTLRQMNVLLAQADRMERQADDGVRDEDLPPAERVRRRLLRRGARFGDG